MADAAISALTAVTAPNPTDVSVVVNSATTKKVALRDMQRPLGARVTHSTTQSIANSTGVMLNFDTEREDTDVCHDNVTNNSRLTAKTAGIYVISANYGFASNTTGYRQLAIILNAATAIGAVNMNANNTTTANMACTTAYRLAVNDFVEVQAFQTSGGALLTQKAGNHTPEFMMWRISA